MQVLTNGTLRLGVVPELGGKIASLVRCESGHEFLLQHDDPAHAPPRYGDAYDAGRSYGFDECVPTVAACRYPLAPFAGRALPDHGELWPVPWHCERTASDHLGEALHLSAEGRALPYRLEKHIRLDGGRVRIHYALENRGDAPFAYSWTAHPLLAAEDGARIVLPPSITRLGVNSSRGNVVGAFGAQCAWPLAQTNDGPQRLDEFRTSRTARADMFFTPKLRAGEGWCGVVWPRANESLWYRFDPVKTPYVGIWITQGGWPYDANPGQYAIALEACTSPNSLELAIECGQAHQLGEGARVTWDLDIELRRADGRT